MVSSGGAEIDKMYVDVCKQLKITPDEQQSLLILARDLI